MKFNYYYYNISPKLRQITFGMNLCACERHVDQDFGRNALLVERMNRQKGKEREGESGGENRRIKYPPYFHGTLP